MKRHRTDFLSLVFGLLFIGAAVTAVFADKDITGLQARWVWPVLLVVGGLVIVGISMARSGEDRAPAARNEDPAQD